MSTPRAALVLALAGYAAASLGQHEDHEPPPPAQAPHEEHEPPSGAGPPAHHTHAAAAPAIREPTDADRAAAFPDLGGMSAQSHMATGARWRVLADRLEWQDADDGDALAWDVEGWFGGDFDRLWLRTEGVQTDGATRGADLELLYGHAFARWWELVAGVRHDSGLGPSRDWMALGVDGLAPFRVEVEVTAYLGDTGRTALRLEAAQEFRLTRRLVLQPRLGLELYGKDDSETGTGSGLSQAEAGVRLRYELRRELAPYLGVTWERRYGDTADFARAAGEDDRDTRFVAGLRAWF